MRGFFRSLGRNVQLVAALGAILAGVLGGIAARAADLPGNALGANPPGADPPAASASEILGGVHWAGPTVDVNAMRGKTVVVLAYATWCPKCNLWSGEFCKQLKTAITDKPVIVLAINNDETPANARRYVAEREFFAPNIVHGYDPAIHKKAGIEQLWSYLIIDSAGNIGERGQAGSFYGQGDAKQFALPKNLSEKKSLGSFTLIDAEMSAELKQALWPLEVGQPSLAAIERKRLDKPTQHKFDETVGGYLGKELEAVRKLAEGEVEEKFQAYDRARAMYTTYPGSGRSKEARKLAVDLETDKKFARELAARRTFEKIENAVPQEKRATQLKRMAKTFAGTQYGERAATAAN